MNSDSHHESTYINIDPCPTEALPPMPTQQRVEPVTVVYSDGSQAPLTYGIPIDWYATYQQLSDGVSKQCDLTEDKQIVLVLLEYNLFSRYSFAADHVSSAWKPQELRTSRFSALHILLCCRPKHCKDMPKPLRVHVTEHLNRQMRVNDN